MKASCIPQALVVAAALALSSSGAFATELHALSEAEMSAVYGQGLGDPALNVLGAMSVKDQGNAAVSATAADALAGLAALSSDVQNLDRQLQQQRLQNATTGMQTTLKITQTMFAVDKALAPIASNVALPVLGMPFMFPLPLAALEAIQNKH
ncbi:MAG TPA: hypothetical protein VIP05_27305 [Burkholderiaceae bacterium]